MREMNRDKLHTDMEEKFGEDYRPLHEAVENPESARYRYRWLIFVLAGVAVVIAAFLMIVAPKAEQDARGPAQVAATIFPLYDITRNIAGDAVSVGLVLPPNASPHTYEPSPSQLVELRDVRLYFAVGHGLDDWADGIFDLTADKVVIDEGIAIISNEDRHRAGSDLGDVHEEDEDEHGETDPHYWLSIPNAKLIALNIRNSLVRRFPAHEAVFEANYRSYLEKLELAENDIRDGFSEVLNRKMITLHDSWYYFAIAYGFDIAGTFEPTPGREPTPRYLADLSATVEDTGVNVLYSEPQIATQGIAPFAGDNGLAIAELDPLGGGPDRNTFIKLMKYNAETIRQHQD